MKFKILYRNFFISLLFLCIIIGISFFQYMNDYFPKQAFVDYKLYKENCLDSYTDSICIKYGITNKESYDYAINNSVVTRRKQLDAKSLTYEVIENNLYCYIAIFMALITSILVCLMMANDIKTKIYQFVLVRNNYKKYIFNKIKVVSFISLLQPISICIIMVVSLLLTSFNLSNPDFKAPLAVYSQFRDNHFFLSVALTCIVTFITNFLFGMISLCISIKENSIIVSIVKSFFVIIVICLLDFFLGTRFLCNIMNFKFNSESLDILFYFILNKESIIVVFLNLLLLLTIVCAYFFRRYGRKEQFYEAVERQNSSI